MTISENSSSISKNIKVEIVFVNYFSTLQSSNKTYNVPLLTHYSHSEVLQIVILAYLLFDFYLLKQFIMYAESFRTNIFCLELSTVML